MEKRCAATQTTNKHASQQARLIYCLHIEVNIANILHNIQSMYKYKYESQSLESL